MSSLVINRSRETRYFDLRRNIVLSCQEILSDRSVFARLNNAEMSAFIVPHSSLAGSRGAKHLLDLVPIPPRSAATFRGREVLSTVPIRPQDFNFRNQQPADQLLRMARRYWGGRQERATAIELSGGLDTSIIIGSLASINVYPTLIGVQHQRYEFRTERVVQNSYQNGNWRVCLLKEELPFSDLASVPVHPVPNVASLYYWRHQKIAAAARDLGVTCIISGDGADAILTPKVVRDSTIRDFRPWAMSEPWFHEHVYQPLSMAHIAPFTFWPFWRLLATVRDGQAADPAKLWARTRFAEFLPRCLVDHAYKADHLAWFKDGLAKCAPCAGEMAAAVYDRFPMQEFRAEHVHGELQKAIYLTDAREAEILDRLSVIVWAYGLKRESLI